MPNDDAKLRRDASHTKRTVPSMGTVRQGSWRAGRRVRRVLVGQRVRPAERQRLLFDSGDDGIVI